MTEEYKHVYEFSFWKRSLDNVINSNEHLYEDFCTSIIKEGTHYKSYRKICSSLAKSIDHIDKEGYIKYKPEDINEVCAYLNYWLNNELKNIESSSKKALDFYNELNKSNSHSPSNINMCQSRINNMDNTVFKDVKFLHNLFFNLDEYKTKFDKGDLVECTYADKFSALYKERKNECITENSSPFCKKFTKFRQEYDAAMPTTKCKGVPKNIQSFDEKSVANGRSDGRIDGISTPVFGDMQGEGTTGSIFPNSLFSGFTLPATIIFGIVSIFILFCKFTPLGTYARSLLQRNKRKFKNTQEEYDYYTFLNTDNSKKNSKKKEDRNNKVELNNKYKQKEQIKLEQDLYEI